MGKFNDKERFMEGVVMCDIYLFIALYNECAVDLGNIVMFMLLVIAVVSVVIDLILLIIFVVSCCREKVLLIWSLIVL